MYNFFFKNIWYIKIKYYLCTVKQLKIKSYEMYIRKFGPSG
jgi:hypothetical protein